MGGTGPGHKSERARLARLANIAKARAARKREPLRWRSGLESRVIEQLVWQWWLESSGPSQTLSSRDALRASSAGKWLFGGNAPFAEHAPGKQGKQMASGWKNEVQIKQGTRVVSTSGRRGVRVAGRGFRKTANLGIGVPFSENARGKAAGKPWAKLRVARLLGVSHTWVNKLVKRFEADPDRMRRRMAAFAPATLEKLERAREETRRQREFGWLRGPIRMRRMKWTVEGKTRRGTVWTQSEKRRREGKVEGRARVPDAELPAWARA